LGLIKQAPAIADGDDLVGFSRCCREYGIAKETLAKRILDGKVICVKYDENDALISRSDIDAMFPDKAKKYRENNIGQVQAT